MDENLQAKPAEPSKLEDQTEYLDLKKTIEEMLDKRGIGKTDSRRPKLLAEVEERAGIATAQTLMASLNDPQKVEFLKILTSTDDPNAETKLSELISSIPGLQQAVNTAIQAEIEKLMDKPL